MPRRPARLSGFSSLTMTLMLALMPASLATAAPPLIEGFNQFRIVDASGRVAPRTDLAASGRVALRPTFSPPLLLRGRPWYLSGYAGATYGPVASVEPLAPTTRRVVTGRWRLGHGR
jgi:hypothetical protein